MRLRRLDMTRYGHFTDRQLDFGESRPGPDLHLVYGPNEAGKSTIFNGFLDLLYGIPGQSPYSFLHSYQTMRIAAALEVDGVTRDVVRIKKPANSLLDPTGQVLHEAVVATALGGVGREAYRSMYSLDDESLESGGEAILESRGDLGELLFSASAGLADLSRKLLEARAKADGFYRWKAQSGELLELKATLKKLKTEREAIDMGAAEYIRLVEARDGFVRRYDDAIAARGALQARLESIAVEFGALPRLVALRRLRERLLPLAHLPEAPEVWAEAARDLLEEAAGLAASATAADAEIDRLKKAADALRADDAALMAEHRMTSLDALKPRAATAEEDLPGRRLTLKEEEARIAWILARIGRAGDVDPAHLVLEVQTVSALRAAIEDRSGVMASLETSRTEIRQASAKLSEARERLASLETTTPATEGSERKVALTALDSAMRTTRASDHTVRARAAERGAAEAKVRLASSTAAAGFDPAFVRSLAALSVPTDPALSALKLREEDLAVELARIASEDDRLRAENSRLQTESRALSLSGIPVSEERIAGARADRERAWARHRSALGEASADGFESAMRRDDLVTSSRLAEATDRARWRQVEEALVRAAAAREVIEAARTQATVARGEHEARIADAWRLATGTDAPNGTSVSDLEQWLSRRAGILEVDDQLRDLQRQSLEAADDGERLGSILREALAKADVASEPGDGLDLLLARAQSCLDAEAEVRALRTAVRERKRELGDRQEALEEAERVVAEWTVDWTRICRSCWLGDANGVPDVDAVRATLDELAALGPALERKAALADRILKMERDASAFANEVDAIAASIGEPTGGLDVMGLAEKISARILSAVTIRQRLEDHATSVASAEMRRRAIEESLDRNARRQSGMAAHFGVATGSETIAKLAAVAERAVIRADLAAVEREIFETLGFDNLAKAEALLDGVDREALARERAELKARLEDEDRRCQELFAAMSSAVDRVEAVGGDAKVLEIDSRRRTTLLEIEDGARRYLRLRAGIAAMDQALRLYKESHRGSMLAKASDAFATMSGGAYSGLRTQPFKDRETLIAISRDGASKDADSLSKGTRFQLYLSLRAAGYLEHAAVRTPPPFVADDIMETFDDFRAEEALRVFSRMAEVGQVVYLTHHKHLLPIAKEVCPSVRIHML